MPITNCPPNLSSNRVCAGGNAVQGVCVGDSGGPLVVPKSTSDFTAVVIGITSHATVNVITECAQTPHAFASVIDQLNWIKNVTGIP